MRREYGYAAFKWKFQLPESADHDKIQAGMKNGVLSIKVPKKAGYIEHKKQITIE